MMTDAEKLWQLVEDLLFDKCDINTFCEEFAKLYNLETDYRTLSKDERSNFMDLCEIAARFSDDENDLALPNVYFGEKQIRDRAQEIYQNLKGGEKTTEAPGKTKYKTFEEVLEAFTGRAPNPERNKVTDEDREKMRELCRKLAELSPEERKKLVTPKPGDIEDFII